MCGGEGIEDVMSELVVIWILAYYLTNQGFHLKSIRIIKSSEDFGRLKILLRMNKVKITYMHLKK